MKKVLLVAVMVLSLAACVEHQEAKCVYPSCWDGALQYTVSEPVETIYKNTTYTTVFEPKTYVETSYTKCKYCGR